MMTNLLTLIKTSKPIKFYCQIISQIKNNYQYFLRYLIIFNRKIKRQFKLYTGYSWDELIDAITVSAVICLFIRIISYFSGLFFSPLYNILLSIIFIFISIKFNLIYYIRENVANFIKITMGEKIKFVDIANDYYLEEDHWSNPNKEWYNKQIIITENHGKMQLYKKDPTYNYSFEEPKENIFNIFIREFFISLIQLRLLIRQIPLLFNILKFLLYSLFILNKLKGITFIISIITILSRIVFYITDFTNKEIINSIYHIYVMQWNRANQTEEELGRINLRLLNSLILATRNNARIMYLWGIRSIINNERKEIYLNENFPKYYIKGGYLSLNLLLVNLKYIPYNKSIYTYEHFNLGNNKKIKMIIMFLIFLLLLYLLSFSPIIPKQTKNIIKSWCDFVLDPRATKKIAKIVLKKEHVSTVHEHPAIVHEKKEEKINITYISTPKPDSNMPELYQQEIIQAKTGHNYGVTGLARVITKKDDPEMYEKIQLEITKPENYTDYKMIPTPIYIAECSYIEMEKIEPINKLFISGPPMQFPLTTLNASSIIYSTRSPEEKHMMCLLLASHFDKLIQAKNISNISKSGYGANAKKLRILASYYKSGDNVKVEGMDDFINFDIEVKNLTGAFNIDTYKQLAIDHDLINAESSLFGMRKELYLTKTSQDVKALNDSSFAQTSYNDKKERQKRPSETFADFKKLGNSGISGGTGIKDS